MIEVSVLHQAKALLISLGNIFVAGELVMSKLLLSLEIYRMETSYGNIYVVQFLWFATS